MLAGASPSFINAAVGVAHAPGVAEPSLALVRGAHVGRRKSDPLRIPPAIGQFSHDAGSCSLEELALVLVHNGGGGSSDACNVLQNEFSRTASLGVVEDVEEEAAALAVEAVASTGE